MEYKRISLVVCVVHVWLATRVTALSSAIPVRFLHNKFESQDEKDKGTWMAPQGVLDDEMRRYSTTACTRDTLGPYAMLIRNVVPLGFCDKLLACARAAGFDELEPRPETFHKNSQLPWALDDQSTEAIFERIRSFLPSKIQVYSRLQSADNLLQEEGTWVRRAEGVQPGNYRLAGLNPQCRLYRYRSGSDDKFPAHIDEVWPGSRLTLSETGEAELRQDRWFGQSESFEFSPGDRVSHLSVLLYLTSHKPGEGGETVLFPPNCKSIKINPRAGDALVFGQSFKAGRDIEDSEHAMLHAGAPLHKSSTHDKIVLRSDVLYYFPLAAD